MKKILFLLLLTLNSCIINESSKTYDEPITQEDLIGGWLETKQEILDLNTNQKTIVINNKDIVIFNENNYILHFYYDKNIFKYALLNLYEYKQINDRFIFNTNDYVIRNNNLIIVVEFNNDIQTLTYYEKVSTSTSINLII